MKFKVTLTLKSGAKHEIEYVWDTMESLNGVKEFIHTLLKSDENAFILRDDTRIDFYIKESISLLSVERG